jgi:hypothetical protein
MKNCAMRIKPDNQLQINNFELRISNYECRDAKQLSNFLHIY